MDFYGFKVLQLKQENDTVWQKAYKDLAKTFSDFILANQAEVTKWAGSANAEEFFNAQLGKSEEVFLTGGAASEIKQQVQTAVGGGLLDDITSGKTVGVALKHVERNAHKKEGAEVKPIPEKKVVVPTKKPAAEEVKREPKQSFKMNSHYLVSDYIVNFSIGILRKGSC